MSVDVGPKLTPAAAHHSGRRKRRVLSIIQNHSVPADRRVWGEAQSLARAGYEVAIISPRGRHIDREAFEMREGIEIHRFPMWFEGSNKWWYLLEYGWSLLACFGLALRVWLTRGFDVLHAGNPPDFFFPLAWFFKIFGKKFVFDQHDLCPETYLSKFPDTEPGMTYRLLLWSERLSQNAADAVIVTNESYRTVVEKRGGIPDSKLFVVRNSPNLEIFERRPPDPSLKEGFDYMAVFVGVMGTQDGVDYLLRAAHHVVHELERRDVFFAIIGTGEAWNDLQTLHRELDLGPHVKFTGRIPDEPMLRYVSTADVGLAPDPKNLLNDISTMQKTMEFMAMALPIVSFDLKESRFSAGDAAVYVPDNDVRVYGKTLVDLLDDPERRHRMGEFGRRRIMNELSWKHSEKNLRATYEHALGRDHPSQAPVAPDRNG